MRTAILATALTGLLVASGWFVVKSWLHLGQGPMPWFLYLALAGGVIFSLLIGCGLMALSFYSHRHGYDDEAGNSHHLPRD